MKYLIALALALCSCSTTQPQGKYVSLSSAKPTLTPSDITAIRMAKVAATSAASICAMTGDVPDFEPFCGTCYYGEGMKTDQPCINEAKQGWNECEQAACDRYRGRVDTAAARRDARLQAATDAYFECMLAANHDPVLEEACYQTAQAAVDAAWATYEAVVAAYKLMYGMEVAACDMEYMAVIQGCCIPCDPWDGWPEN